VTGANYPPRAGIFLARGARLTRMGWTVERLIEEIDRLGSQGLPREEFFAELSPRLRNVIDNDASCWHTLDPSTRLLTSDAPKELIERGVFALDEAPGRGGDDRPQAREREVATLLARGLSRAEMAETLVVSPHTVEDHVKNLYEKLGVASRQEFVARVFLDEYLPEVVRQTPLTSRGRFDRE